MRHILPCFCMVSIGSAAVANSEPPKDTVLLGCAAQPLQAQELADSPDNRDGYPVIGPRDISQVRDQWLNFGEELGHEVP